MTSNHLKKTDLLKILSTRTTLFGIETHLASIHTNIDAFDPELVVFDPVTDLIQIGDRMEVRGMLLRIIDILKSRMVTVLFTALTSSGLNRFDLGMSSLVDSWFELGILETAGEREQVLRIVKIRGMKHSRRGFILDFTSDGLKIRDMD